MGDARADRPRRRAPAATGGYAWTRRTPTLREWFAGEAAAARAGRGRPTATATSGPGGATRTPTARRRHRLATWTRCPTAARSTARSASCQRVRRGRPAARARAFAPARPLGVVVLRRRGGRPVRHRLRGSRLLTGALDRRPGRAALHRRRRASRWPRRWRAAGHDPARLGPRRRDAAPDRHLRRAARRAGPRRWSTSAAPVGVGSGIWPHGRWRLDFAGEANHAGTTRLADRHDPMLGLRRAPCSPPARAAEPARLRRHRRQGRASSPNGVNAIPSPRHRPGSTPAAPTRPPCARGRRRRRRRSPTAHGATVTEESWTPTDARSTRTCARPARRRCSARRAGAAAPAPATTPASSPTAGVPTAMLFVRNPTGVSHSPAEHAERDDCLAGVAALADVARRPGRSRCMTTYWAGATRWLGCRPGSARGVRSRSTTAGSPRSTPDVRPAPGDAAAARRGPARPRQRALPRLPPGAARAHPRRRRHLLDLARADVRRRRPARPGHATSRWPAPCTPRWRWPGSPPSASSTTCTTRPAARRYDDPNAMGEALIAGRRARPGIRLTLLDTCYLAGGLDGDGHLPLDAVQRRFCDGDVDAWAARVGAAAPDATGAADRRGRPLGAGRARATSSPVVGRAAARPAAARAPVRAAGRERRLPGRATAAPRPSCSPTTGVLGPRTTAVHATHLTDDDIALLGGTGTGVLLLPDHRARPRRRHRPGPRAARRRRPLTPGLATSTPSIDLFEEARGAGDARAAASPASAAASAGRAARAPPPRRAPRLGWPDAGRASRRARAADLVAVRLDTPAHRRAPTRRRSCFAATAADVHARGRRRAASSSRGGRHRARRRRPRCWPTAIEPLWEDA